MVGIKRIVDHVRASKKFGTDLDGVEQKNKVALVHDDGVYLLSNGEPRDLVKGKSPNGLHDREMSFVVYAEGCNPMVDGEDCWPNSVAMVGGDDFVEYLDVEVFEKALANKATSVFIELAKTKMSVGYIMPPLRKTTQAERDSAKPKRKKPSKKAGKSSTTVG